MMPKVNNLRTGIKRKLGQMNLAFVLFVITAPFAEPQMFKVESFQFGDQIFDILKLISVAAACCIYFALRRPSLLLTLTLLLQILILLCTLINYGTISRFAGPAITMITMVMVGEVVVDEGETRRFTGYLKNYLSLLVAANFVTLLLINLHVLDWEVPLLGIDNRWIYILLPWVIVSFINAAINKGCAGPKEWAIYAVVLIHVLYSWAVGAILSLAMWPLLWIIGTICAKSSSWLAKHANVLLTLTLLIGLNVLLFSGVLLDVLRPVIVNLLGKDVTLSGRIYLWDTVLEVLRSNPLWGMGVQPDEFDKEFFFEQSGYVIGCAVNHPHNYLLNVAYHGGIVSALIFIAIYLYAAIGIDKAKGSTTARVLFCSLGCVLVASLVDTMDFGLFHLLIPFSVCAPRIISSNGNLQMTGV